MSRGLPIDSLTSEKRDYQDSGKLAQTVGRSTRKEVETRKGRKEKSSIIRNISLAFFTVFLYVCPAVCPAVCLSVSPSLPFSSSTPAALASSLHLNIISLHFRIDISKRKSRNLFLCSYQL